MRAETFAVAGPLLLEPKVFGDSRGFFMESYNRRTMAALGVEGDFVQDNHSLSRKGTVRGLHYQVNRAQAKLVRVVRGTVFDVAVDIRPGSPTFGQWVGVTLSAENKRLFYVPRGFAHGFQVLSEEAEFTYKCDNYYSPDDERCLLWNDPTVAIAWPGAGEPLLSAKDRAGAALGEIDLGEDILGSDR